MGEESFVTKESTERAMASKSTVVSGWTEVTSFSSLLEALAALHSGEVEELRAENARLQDEYDRLQERFELRWGPTVRPKDPQDLGLVDPDGNIVGCDDEAATMAMSELHVDERWAALSKALVVSYEQGHVMKVIPSEESVQLRDIWKLAFRRDSAEFISVVREGNKSRMFLATAPKERHWSVDPTQTRYVLWGVLGMHLLIWDLLVLPLTFFDVPTLHTMIEATGYVALTYWSMDLVLQFFVWVPSNDLKKCIWETSSREIAKRYLRTWFIPDVVILGVDFLMLALESSTTQARGVLRAAKIIRFLRVARLLRVRKCRDVADRLMQRQNSEHLVVGLQMSKSVLLLLLMSHYVACFWFALAYFNDDDPETWLLLSGLREESASYMYIVSMHWVMTQFSPATNNISPANFRERAFALGVVVYALVVFSSFVSGLTNAVNQLRRINMDRTVEESLVQQFLRTRNVSPALSSDIKTFFKYSYEARKKRVRESDLPFFSAIPKALRVSLHVEVYLPRLQSSTLWIFSTVDQTFLAKICHYCIREKSVLPGQEVFEKKSKAESVWCGVSGTLVYDTSYDNFAQNRASFLGERSLLLSASSSLTLESGKKNVLPGEWMAELALFVHWEHMGQLMAEDTSEMVFLDVPSVISVSETCSGSLMEIMRRFVVMLLALLRVESSGVKLSDMPLSAPVLLGAAERAWKFWQMSGGGKRHEYRHCWGTNSAGEFDRFVLPQDRQALRSMRSTVDW